MKLLTSFLLLAEYESPHVEITEIGRKYFGFDDRKAKTQAALNAYPFPVFRSGGQKSVWLVDVVVLAEYLDSVKQKAEIEFKTAKPHNY